jgi:hypothetical protein
MSPRSVLAHRRSLPLVLLVAAVVGSGCGGAVKPPPNADVSGKVYYKGQPLPGGLVSFVTVKGGFASGGTIDENGNYKVTAPVGEVLVTVDNTMLKTGRGVPREGPHPKNPDAPAPQEMKGRYVAIPNKYANADQSGLKYTVVEGPQTYDIKLE